MDGDGSKIDPCRIWVTRVWRVLAKRVKDSWALLSSTYSPTLKTFNGKISWLFWRTCLAYGTRQDFIVREVSRQGEAGTPGCFRNPRRGLRHKQFRRWHGYTQRGNQTWLWKTCVDYFLTSWCSIYPLLGSILIAQIFPKKSQVVELKDLDLPSQWQRYSSATKHGGTVAQLVLAKANMGRLARFFDVF